VAVQAAVAEAISAAVVQAKQERAVTLVDIVQWKVMLVEMVMVAARTQLLAEVAAQVPSEQTV
jgi:hypothetical protein